MQLTAPTVAVSTSPTDTDAILCGIDTDGAVHLMRLLSNLYSNASASVLREYSTNAYDAHVQAGNPDPIEVTLPTQLNPTLIITDHGVGLSEDELIEVYARYGASTKRDSNSQVGAFGLGAKSAFTLGQQFLVTATKNGRRTVAAFGLNAEGSATVRILDREETTQPNGVTVAISVDDPEAVQRASGPVFSVWQPGAVLVNGEHPRSILDNALSITQDIHLAESVDGSFSTWGEAGLIVVMGGVGYPVSPGLLEEIDRRMSSTTRTSTYETLLLGAYQGQRVYATVDIGDVDVAPSREELRDTTRTVDRLVQIATEYSDGVEALVLREVTGAPTAAAAARSVAALSRRRHLRQAIDDVRTEMTWEGQPLAYAVKVPYSASVYSPTEQRCSHERDGFRLYLTGSDLDKTLVVTDVPGDRREAAMRSAKAFLKADPAYRRLVFAPAGAESVDWFSFGRPDTFPAISFDEYVTEVGKRRRPKSRSGERSTQVTQYATRIGSEEAVWRTAKEIVDLGLPIVTVNSRADLSSGLAMRHKPFAQAVRAGVVIVELTGGRTREALQRRLGSDVSVTSLHEHANGVAADIAASITDEDRKLERICATGTISTGTRQELINLRHRITNTVVTDELDRMQQSETVSDEEKARLSLINGARMQRPDLMPAVERQPSLTVLFPLLGNFFSYSADDRTRDHVVAYLNAVARSV